MCLTLVLALGFTTLTKNIALGVLALGVVIFVHELGHFIVAKLCGVQCDKFYIGFDPPMPFGLPSTLFKMKIGETEYGIGIIPLGGYVKMLGQDDNPANAAREAQRIRMAREQNGEIETEGEIKIDPRSYPAKPVWQRMLIISAGVVMNLISAVGFGAAAYRYGMLYTPCVVGETSPGLSGWQVGLEPGDKILQIGRNGKYSEHLRFQNDLAVQIAMREPNSTVDLLVRRYEQSEPEWITVLLTTPKPEEDFRPYIGISPSSDLTILKLPDPAYSTLSATKAPFQAKKDRVVAVDGHPVADYAAFSRYMADRFDHDVVFTVEREMSDGQDDDAEKTVERVDVPLAKTPMRWIGIGTEVGPIVSIQKGSPAEQAGFQRGDIVLSVDGVAVQNASFLPFQLDRLAGKQVTIRVQREGEGEITLEPILRRPNILRLGPPDLAGFIAAESLGIAFSVSNRIAMVEPASPAADHGCQPGDVITEVEFLSPRDRPQPMLDILASKFDFNQYPDLWSVVHSKMQYILPSTKIRVTYSRNGKSNTFETTTVAAKDWYAHYRGLLFPSAQAIHQVTDLRAALALGLRETKEGLEHVVTVLQKLVGGKLSPKNLGGPLTIAAVAGQEASESPSRLLAFLTMLSANVAVLNFLPIPVLDGGHAMFLIYEAIFRKPLDERLAFGLTLIGFVFILTLMILVLGLDIHRLGTLLFMR